MNDFTIIYNHDTIPFNRDIDGTLQCGQFIAFVKFIRESAGCSLVDAKNFADDFIRNFNKLEPNADKVRSNIKLHLDRIEDVNALLRIFQTVQQNITH